MIVQLKQDLQHFESLLNHSFEHTFQHIRFRQVEKSVFFADFSTAMLKTVLKSCPAASNTHLKGVVPVDGVKVSVAFALLYVVAACRGRRTFSQCSAEVKL